MESNSVIRRLLRLRRAPLLALVVVGFVAQRLTQLVLDRSYARSGYPVPYYEGQLAFSADKLEGWYATMQAAGSLDVYRQTQMIDFAFIAATALFFVVLLAALVRSFAEGTSWRRIGVTMIGIGLAAPLFDVVENLISFVMLARPEAIDGWVALLYSTMAAAKFACFALVYAWVAIVAVAAVVRLGGRTRRERRRAH